MPPAPTKESAIDAIYAHARASVGVGHTGAAPMRSAVACLLWRRTPGAGLELYFAQRAASMAFLGGYWTFCGGSIDSGDRDGIAAAIREMHEELGIVLRDEPARFVDAGRWITPAFSPIRFDTRYYLVELDSSADPDWRASGGELQDGAWVTPGQVLEKWRTGDWLIPAPAVRVAQAIDQGIDGAAARCRELAERANDAPRVWDLSPGVAMSVLRTPTLPPATHTNCFLFGSGEMIAVDPASPYPDEQAVLARALESLAARGRRLVEIWLTHHHLDHVGGAEALSELTGAPIAAHPETADRLAGRVRIDRRIEDGEFRVLAGPEPRRIRAIHTPGHAPGHLCVLEEETGFMAAGDMVAGVGTILVDPSEGDMAAYLDSLRLLRSISPRALLPAHGGVITQVADKLDGYVKHRLWRETRVVEALRGMGAGEPGALVPTAYADVSEGLHPLAERSLLAHLLKLEADGVATRDGSLWRLA